MSCRLRPSHRRAISRRIGAERTCARKVAHSTQAQAEAAMAEMRAQPNFVELPGKRLHIYRCPAGPHWHVGNTGETGRRTA